MLVILHPRDYNLWLEGDTRDLDLLTAVLRPYPASEMISYPVSTLVNNPAHEGAELIEELASSLRCTA